MSTLPESSFHTNLTPRPFWIINSRIDLALIVLTPLVVIPVVLGLHLRGGVKAETIALIVTAFFAVGHHLPGLIRAYGDTELFQRFRWRFLLAPPILFSFYLLLNSSHKDFLLLVILIWATWHGLMQLYGFVRIYDAKVGSVARTTAFWDWMICLCGFFTVEIYSADRMAFTLNYWYSIGGPLIPPSGIHAFRWFCLILTSVSAIGFVTNLLIQWKYGVRPNPIKLLLLSTGIGTWWFAIGYLDNILLGAALFDIFHDVQYLAIVWMFNCRRVSTDPRIRGFMRVLFRRGMVLLYLGLIVAYGSIGLIPSLVNDGTILSIVNALLGTSTILHYYYDGFIWKVRERRNQESLGVSSNTDRQQSERKGSTGAGTHILKWLPLAAIAGSLLISQQTAPSVSAARKKDIERQYTKTLTGVTVLPDSVEERNWLYTLFERVQNMAAALPENRPSQLRSAVMLANFGRNEEAISTLNELLVRHPDCSEASTFLGGIHAYMGNIDRAAICFETAVLNAGTGNERAMANLKLGEIHLQRKNYDAAEVCLTAALKDNPQLQQTIEGLRRSELPRGNQQ